MVSVNSDSDERIRRLYQEAGVGVRYGNMPVNEALKMITLNPAKQLGVDKMVGTLDVGKDGDIAVFSAHPFAPTAMVEYTIIDGKVYFDRAKRDAAQGGDAGEWPGRRPMNRHLRYAASDARDVVALAGDVRAQASPGADGHVPDQGRHRRHGTGEKMANTDILIRNGRIAQLGSERHGQRREGHRRHRQVRLSRHDRQLHGNRPAGDRRHPDDEHAQRDGQFNPHLSALVALNVESELLGVTRMNGVRR